MASIGIWLWSYPFKFSLPLDSSCDPVLTVVRVPAQFSSKPLCIIHWKCIPLFSYPASTSFLPSPSSSLFISGITGLEDSTYGFGDAWTRLLTLYEKSSCQGRACNYQMLNKVPILNTPLQVIFITIATSLQLTYLLFQWSLPPLPNPKPPIPPPILPFPSALQHTHIPF
jgi:hypothetical protein